MVPTVLQPFTSSPSKADTSLRQTVGAGPECVRLSQRELTIFVSLICFLVFVISFDCLFILNSPAGILVFSMYLIHTVTFRKCR